MPKRTDIKKILLIGSGPIIIGQACEFDYSGTQACRALKQEGYEVVLVNSNPATIMTDPQTADKTYIEPITPEVVEKIIARERPDALLPTLGGQTGLNTAVELYKRGVLEHYGVELIGAHYEAIQKAEDRDLFKQSMQQIGLKVCRSRHVNTVEEALVFAAEVGYPVIIRPSFTLGGTGGGIAYNVQEMRELAAYGIEQSPIGEILVEESIIGWKEFELEVMRDRRDNVVIICSIENFDPMGIHTGDSITVAPAQTLTDREYQDMRDAAIKVIREIGVETGGSNIQFAINPADGRMIVVEMNPRVSRSSALASKATGFPIAKIAAKLAVGYTLDELPNDITRETPACFEPTIDYCVVKIPRWDFAKFPGADRTLTTQMKSVGEVMSIGRTFKEALQKAIRSLEQDRYGLGVDGKEEIAVPARAGGRNALLEEVRTHLVTPGPERIFYLRHALRLGMSLDEINAATDIDRWFLDNIRDIVEMEKELTETLRGTRGAAAGGGEQPVVGEAAGAPFETGAAGRFRASGFDPADRDGTGAGKSGLHCEGESVEMNTVAGLLARLAPELLLRAKQYGFSDRQLAHLAGTDELTVRGYRLRHGIRAAFKLVDTCAAEFEAFTPYYYSTYEPENEVPPATGKKVIILGGGPNRIGQGIEFDYCCVQAAFALKEAGYQVIMVNCNPETVSTDYDTSDRLYFEPLTLEDVLNICDLEKPDGVILQFGGQTPLKLARALEREGIRILGTSPASIDLAEDREKFAALINRLGLRQPASGTCVAVEEAKKIAAEIGYPVLVRPSYVLGGRAMEVVYDGESLAGYMSRAVEVSSERPVLIDKFLEGAIEVDVDAISDGCVTIVGGVMEHIEEAGIHSGDSACSLPPFGLPGPQVEEMKRQARLLARELNVIGLLNIQFAVENGDVYVLEVNPRASRTIPFVSKATGVPLARLATRVMLGQSLAELGLTREAVPRHVSVKEAVFPFIKFPGVDIILGPEMRSTGEVMGIDDSFGMAFAKSQLAAGMPLPLAGTVLLTVADRDKEALLPVARGFAGLGFKLMATRGTARFLQEHGLRVMTVHKLGKGRPNIVDHIKNGDIDLVINTPIGKGPKYDEYHLRRQSITHGVHIITTIRGALAALEGISTLRGGGMRVKTVQEYEAQA
ncbi:carbamoyl-phosphate synthase large subunit [Desulfotomaculum copahuensis]|uniref:Carbamoyl phosphate synthase large chain n=1 Tax=Desulfotomaculum copahuensis TaxID=1838280 RepID=A0A1B7LAH4_9FIRM|nr:carbamoyl-phosphate synthase large subunit [Desulfotomaculum copahuensis]OAT79290.1 carbamoyl phosphate synthase large subunit [Desulfotomaculum copahuensis]